MKYWEWGDTGLAILAALVVAVFSIGTYAVFQDHTVRFYYMSSHGGGSGRNGFCVDGYRNWYANDSGVFCSDEIQQAVTVLKELNDGLKERGVH